MKVRKNLILRKVGDTWAVFPIAEQLGYYGNIMRLNETGAFLWKCLCKEVTKDELEAALMKEYEITGEVAQQTVGNFVAQLKEQGIIESEQGDAAVCRKQMAALDFADSEENRAVLALATRLYTETTGRMREDVADLLQYCNYALRSNSPIKIKKEIFLFTENL